MLIFSKSVLKNQHSPSNLSSELHELLAPTCSGVTTSGFVFGVFAPSELLLEVELFDA